MKATPESLILKTLTAFAITICLMAGAAHASVTVYQASDSTTNFVPDKDDGTPGRPGGAEVGNTITLTDTQSYISSITVKIGTLDPNIANQDVTLSLYQNDGAADPGGSGLLQPGTLIDSQTITNVSLFAGVVPVTFNYPSLLVPGTFTFIIGLSPGSSGSSYAGAMTNNSAPQIGSAVNTLWFGTGIPGAWTTSSTWVIADGAATNYIDAVIMAGTVPEPPITFYLALGSAAVWLNCMRNRRAK